MDGLARRELLASAAALAAMRPAWVARDWFLAARDDAGGRHFVGKFASNGAIAYDLCLPGRGHGVALSLDGRIAVAVARRPGQFALVFDPHAGTGLARIAATDGHFFCGHAVFSADSRLLYTTESRSDDAEGFVGVHDSHADWRRVASWPTQGSDPHELLLAGHDLFVANGGFRQDGGPMIDPSLVCLDARDGTMRAQVKPPEKLREVSLRHLAIADGAVFAAGQYAGPNGERPPLVARWDRDGLTFIDLGERTTAGLANYCGSIAAGVDGARLCVTSPRGGRTVVLDAKGVVLAEISVPDGCGVAATGDGGFLVTSGRGALCSLPGGPLVTVADARWDIHACRL